MKSKETPTDSKTPVRQWRAVERKLVRTMGKGTPVWSITDSHPASSIERPIAACWSQEKADALCNLLNASATREAELVEALADAKTRADVNHEAATAYRLCVEESDSNEYHLRDWIQETRELVKELADCIHELHKWQKERYHQALTRTRPAKEAEK